MLSNLIKSVLLFGLVSQLWASEYNKDISFKDTKGTEYQMKLELYEEPVDTPFRLSFYVKCGKKKKAILDKYPICDYSSYKLDEKKSHLEAHILDYNPDNGKCDIKRVKTLSLKNICK